MTSLSAAALEADETDNFAKVLVEKYAAGLETDLSQMLEFLASISRSGLCQFNKRTKSDEQGGAQGIYLTPPVFLDFGCIQFYKITYIIV